MGGVFPTGIQSPAACRYASLTNGLTKVGAPGRVIAISASLPATFGGETFPLNVPAGVTVMTADATFNTTDYAIDFSGGSSYAVVLEQRLVAARVHDRRERHRRTALIFCGAPAGPVLDTLALHRQRHGRPTASISAGACAATLRT